MRALIQSTIDFHFLCSSPINGDMTWTPSLATALAYGLITSEEQASQIAEDHADRGYYIVVDLDNLPEPR